MKQAQLSTEKAQNQLYEISSQSENRLSALTIENNLLAEGSQRLTSRIIELENEINTYKNNVNLMNINNMNNTSTSSSNSMTHSNHNHSSTGTSTGAGSAEISSHDDLQTLKLVISELRHELRKKDDLLYSEKVRYEKMTQNLTQQLSHEKTQLLQLRQDLSERPLKDDYIAIKRQLKLLTKITFHIDENDEDSNNDDVSTYTVYEYKYN